MAAAGPAAAQDLSVWLDAAGSDALPPAGALGETTLYSVFGGRIGAAAGAATMSASGRYGAAVSGDAGRWLQGDGSLFAGGHFGGVAVRMGASAFGLRYLEPFTYAAGGGGVEASLALPVGPLTLIAAPRWTAGTWAADSLDGHLRVAGGSLELLRSHGPFTVSGGAEALDVSNGAVDGAFLRATAAGRFTAARWTATAHLDVQRTPLENSLGGGVTLGAGVSAGVQLQLDVGRTLRDPLFGTAGSFAITLGVSVRAVNAASTPPSIVEVGASSDGGRRVSFSLPVRATTSVALVGDFTGWQPRPMERRGGRWVLELVLEPGLHHFGFLIDGNWAVPPNAPGLVEDGWGRRNASVVIEP